MRKTICLLVLLLTACTAIAPIPTAIPPTASPTIVPTPTLTPTPDARTRMFNDIQAEGINVTHIGDDADGGWGLLINGEEVPGTFFNEEGEILHVQLGDKPIEIPGENASARLQLNADGILLLNDGNGKNIAMFDPANPEASWVEVIKQFPVCDAAHFRDCGLSAEDLGVDGDYAKWVEKQVAGLNIPLPDSNKVLVSDFAADGSYRFIYQNNAGGSIAEADRPFLVGLVFGNIQVEATPKGKEPFVAEMVVVPVVFSVPGKPGETVVINVLYEKPGWSEEELVRRLSKLNNDGRIGLAVISNGVINPISDMNNANFPGDDNIKDRLAKFKQTLDPTWIEGIIFYGYYFR